MLGASSKQHQQLNQLAGQHQHQQQQQQQQQQPLINASQQTMLQFQHQTLQHQHHHPYSTLYLQQQQQQQPQQLNNGHQRPMMHQTLHHPHPLQHHQLHQPSNSQASAATNASHLLLQHQQQQQQQQHNYSQQQQQYNMNSDYSSSTYHIYDQISDLIIIKQQRMERKRQLEQRRKVILIALAATLLVSTVSFLVYQALFGGQQPSQAASFEAAGATQRIMSWPATHVAPSAPKLDGPLPLNPADVAAHPSPHQFQYQFQYQYQQPAQAPVQAQPQPQAPTHPHQHPHHLQHQLQLQPSAHCHCSGNGQCLSPLGPCKCYPGFTGPQCQERDKCHGLSCLNDGVCIAALGVCQCKFAFKGSRCEFRDEESWQRLVNCSQHGHYDARQASCVCDAGFGGFDCSEERCDPNSYTQLDCSPNGLFDCRQNRCICQDGYSGAQCQIQQCSAQCLRNGQCMDGACTCKPGFYGKHCSLNGCPNQCSQRGQCVRVQQQQQPTSGEHHQQVAEWRCQCQPGSMGDDCGILLERQCDDGLDNDHDGLVDCADSECCSDRACQNSTLCMKSPDPLDILMRKQPPPPTSSFFQRMQFLIEKYSSQTYSSPRDFNDSRASVIRGRVTYMRQGVTGVRVSVAGQTNVGMTLTRDGGYFDLLVNGGGAVTIEFRREPFATKQKIVRVPWNEIVLIDQIEFKLESSGDLLEPVPSVSPEPDSPSCFAHNYKLMRPHILTQAKSWRAASLANKSPASWPANLQSRAVILRDSGMVQQDIQLPGSQDLFSGADVNQSAPVSLIYTSSRANEFMSTISIQLTPPSGAGQDSKSLPQELKAIHLRIVIEGNLFEQLFEPQMNLTYTYAWNRRNVYRQKSFGLSTASVSVGYEYFDCKHVIWNTNHVQLAGHDLSISDIGSQWNLNIHHRYNYRDSILQRADGRNFNLKTDKQRVVQQVLGGNGQPRQTLCPHCDAGSGEQRLLRPQALVSSPDGSLYVADFNLIRRIEWSPATGGPNKQQHPTASSNSPVPEFPVIKTILELPSSRVPSKYSLALNLADQRLYMSDIDRHQIYLIREQQQLPGELNETTGSPLYPSEESLLPVVGDGVRCQLDDGTNCGDRQPARLARLIAPKAFTFDLSGRMYIADGPNVRMVDTDAKIYTILGDYGVSGHTKFPCSGEAVPMHKFVPKSPQDVAFNPIDDTLFILDDNVVYKVTQDKRVQVVAGRLAHCVDNNNNPFDITKTTRKPKATEVQLLSAQSIAFSQNGELFISEDDQAQQISRVLMVNPEEDSISLFAGMPVEQLAAAANRGLSIPTVDSVHQIEQLESAIDNSFNDKQRASNSLPLKGSQVTRATDYKFNSIAAIAVDQQGRLLVADKLQLKILSIEPDLPQINGAGEFELQSPDNPDELLIFNRFGHHLATRDTSRSGAQRGSNKYTFSYTVNTSFGLLGSVSYASGNKISIYRDGPHHAVRMIETAYKGQCKLDISRTGQVLSISTIAPDMTKTSLTYHNDGGLLKQSKDSASGELFDFSYDEFGRATRIKHSSPRLPAPVECSVGPYLRRPAASSSYISQHCSALIVSQ